jgi:DNA-directed RNA polymerase subunit M/transcription elongation factor TFIIS
MEPIRAKVKSLFQRVLSEDDSILLEKAIHEYFLKHSETTYQNLAYQIYGKLSPSLCSDLIQQIKNEKILFQGSDFRLERDKDEKEAKNIETPLDVKEGVNKCSKCGSKKTFQFSLQIRSCDEPATIFLTCAMCGHRWRIG